MQRQGPGRQLGDQLSRLDQTAGGGYRRYGSATYKTEPLRADNQPLDIERLGNPGWNWKNFDHYVRRTERCVLRLFTLASSVTRLTRHIYQLPSSSEGGLVE